MRERHDVGISGSASPRVTSSPADVGVWVVDGAAAPGWKRPGNAAEISVSARGVGSSPAASVRVHAFGEGARGLGVRGSGRGRPLGHGERSRR
jgi:hypothetical protein